VKEEHKENPNEESAYTRSEDTAPNEDAEEKKSDNEFDNVRVIPPKMPKEFIHVVRPENVDKENSIISLTSKMANTVREAADETFDSIKHMTESVLGNEADSKHVTLRSTNQQYTKDEKDVYDNVSIEKKWVTKKTRIDVPVRYERIFINGDELKFGVEDAFGEIKERILDTVAVENDNKNNTTFNWVPLFGHGTKMKSEIPLYAEELIVSKRKVIVGKVIIRKRQITKKKIEK
jgi:stress response protein YsnF